MQTNQVPHYDDSVNPTACCPKFNPDGWDGAELHFENKPFLRAQTRSAMHIPLNIGKVFARVDAHMKDAGGWDTSNMIILSRDISPWKSEHFFSTDETVADEEMTTLTGDFVTKVFEGPYKDARHWIEEMRKIAAERGKEPKEIFFFYTTCPKCAKHYGKNYVVGVVQI
ncbi:hydrolase [Tropicimonas marinistellae]|uniref:hydrolase n=1 Tax=Tropicimonas marinistellae TaxID=1739787 RepID=UPI00082A5038|nr:hydrolase [Tropicimonas marinistellae]